MTFLIYDMNLLFDCLLIMRSTPKGRYDIGHYLFFIRFGFRGMMMPRTSIPSLCVLIEIKCSSCEIPLHYVAHR